MAHVIRTALRFRVFWVWPVAFVAVFLKCWGVDYPYPVAVLKRLNIRD